MLAVADVEGQLWSQQRPKDGESPGVPKKYPQKNEAKM
jgi:hypothetical protein